MSVSLEGGVTGTLKVS
ncbi:unnamed protein product, partial [Allacma fusca]